MHESSTLSPLRACGSLRLLALALVGCLGCVLVLSASAAPPRAYAYRTLAPGFSSTCAITVAGAARCWGNNAVGQLGNRSRGQTRVPVTVVGLGSGVTAVTTGVDFACAIVRGAAKCWGGGTHGELGNGVKMQSDVRPVAVTGLQSGVKAIDAGHSRTCAITRAGGVKCWGAAILGNGSSTESARPVDVVGLTSGAKAVSVGGQVACALTAAGGVKCWGGGVLGNGTGLSAGGLLPVDVSGLTSGVKQVSVGFAHTCVLTAAGGVKCWGENQQGSLGNGRVSTAPTLVPADVPGLTSGVTAIAAGYYHTCVLLTGGVVKCWGPNSYGQLGRQTPRALSPVNVVGLGGGVRAIAAGGDLSCAIDRKGITKCWGSNSSLQAGWTPSRVKSAVPRAVYGQSAQRALTSARFLSPTRNLSCELSDRPGRISVYCQSLDRPHSVTMDGRGRMRICRGTRCLGDPAQGTPTLGYGRRKTVGRFECRSQVTGVRCVVASTGKGFLIDKAGVRRIG